MKDNCDKGGDKACDGEGGLRMNAENTVVEIAADDIDAGDAHSCT